VWAMRFTCKNIVYSNDVARHAQRVTVIAPNKMTTKQALQLFVDAVEATGLVVVQKSDSIIIKLGPGMTNSCPDVAVDAPIPSAPYTPPNVGEPPVVEDHDFEAELDKGIKTIDETHRTVSRALVDKILANPMAVAKGARIVPAVKNGKPDGFKLYAIRPSSMYARLGLMNGDTLQAVNGFELTSADQALEVYTKLREATSLEIELMRRGKPVKLFISIK
jgi:general secretion pathway protein C